MEDFRPHGDWACSEKWPLSKASLMMLIDAPFQLGEVDARWVFHGIPRRAWPQLASREQAVGQAPGFDDAMVNYRIKLGAS